MAQNETQSVGFISKYIMEFIGTFFLIFTIVLTVGMNNPFAPIAIGFVLMVMVYAGAHISGANYNPAVSLTLLLLRKLKVVDTIFYIIFQLLGGIAASYLYLWLAGKAFVGPLPSQAAPSIYQPLVIEIIFAFLLIYVILQVAVSNRTQGNNYFGLAIGSALMIGVFAGGVISGGAFNPAVGFCPNFVAYLTGTGSLNQVWIYIVGPIAGGLLAAIIYKMTE